MKTETVALLWCRTFLATVVVTLCSYQLVGCIAQKPLDNAPCPCLPGWTCVESTQVCVVDTGPGMGGQQAGGAAGGSGGIGGTGGQPVVTVDAGPPASACPALIPTDTTPGDLVAGCPCTRRPGAGNSYSCPVGANESTRVTIGPQGGTLSLAGRQGRATAVDFILTIPPGALAQPTEITVTETNLSPPTGFVDYSPVYHVEPDGLALGQIAALHIPSISNLTLVPHDLAIYQSSAADTCVFHAIGDSYNNAGFEQSSLTRTGYLFVAAPQDAAQASCP